MMDYSAKSLAYAGSTFERTSMISYAFHAPEKFHSLQIVNIVQK